IRTQALQFTFNVQHDCQAHKCEPTGSTRQLQERQETNRVIRSIVHKDDTNFIINLHALHNATLLRKFLPRYMTVPRPLFLDRRKRLDELGVKITEQMLAKKAATTAKAAETRKKNNQAKAAAAAAKAGEEVDNIDNAEGETVGGKRQRR
ncbi:hypothetical protein BYT27DRAFT_7105864, partial [Phlegmacium glaucopus]